jgi:hypothetical protein
MKLYTKISSERASKGQGGNDYIAIKLTMLDENKMIKTFCNLHYHINEHGQYELLNADTNDIIYVRGAEVCPDNHGDHKWYKPYINEDVQKCLMCDKVKETKGDKKKGEDNTCGTCGKNSKILTRDLRCTKCDKIVA